MTVPNALFLRLSGGSERIAYLNFFSCRLAKSGHHHGGGNHGPKIDLPPQDQEALGE